MSPPGPCPLCGVKVHNWTLHLKEETDSIHRGFILPPRKRTRTPPAPPINREFMRLRGNRIKRTAGVAANKIYMDDTERDVAMISELCFMCHEPMDMSDMTAVNAHIDACLSNVPAPSPVSSEYLSAPSICLSSDEDEDTYTWAGQKRIRVTSMFLELLIVNL
jgi:hypothetical protein